MREEAMMKSGIGFGRVVAAMVVGTWLAGAGVAMATMPIQKKAKELGFKITSCQSCHVDKLPKKDASKLSDRGQWLKDEKDKRKAKEVDPAWLKDYVEKKKAEEKK